MKLKIVLLITIFVFSFPVMARQKIVIGTGLKPPLVQSETQPGFLDSLVTQAFDELGIDLEILIIPAGRVLINVNNGIEDGCLLRIKGLEAKFPNLVRVPEMLMVSEFVGYTRKEIPTDSGLAKYQSHSISYVTGWQIFDRLFTDHPDVTYVKSPDQMFSLMARNRVDIVLYERWQGLGVMCEMEMSGVKLIQPSLASMDMFMYLHKKHQALVPRLTEKLVELKANGAYQKYYQHYLTSLAEESLPE